MNFFAIPKSRRKFNYFLFISGQFGAIMWTSLWQRMVFHETNFPKHTDDFDEVSRYLEEHADFCFNLSDFDAIWEDYQAH